LCVPLNRKIALSFTDNQIHTKSIEVFDQLGELLDDMMDVEEDIDAINPNRFLISLVAHGTVNTRMECQTCLHEKIQFLTEYRDFLMIH